MPIEGQSRLQSQAIACTKAAEFNAVCSALGQNLLGQRRSRLRGTIHLKSILTRVARPADTDLLTSKCHQLVPKSLNADNLY